MFHTLADAEGLAIELDATEFAFRIGHDQRLERRHAGQRLQAESVRIGGYDAPCEHFEALFAHDLEMACSCWPEVAMSRSKKAMPAA